MAVGLLGAAVCGFMRSMPLEAPQLKTQVLDLSFGPFLFLSGQSLDFFLKKNHSQGRSFDRCCVLIFRFLLTEMCQPRILFCFSFMIFRDEMLTPKAKLVCHIS